MAAKASNELIRPREKIERTSSAFAAMRSPRPASSTAFFHAGTARDLEDRVGWWRSYKNERIVHPSNSSDVHFGGASRSGSMRRQCGGT